MHSSTVPCSRTSCPSSGSTSHRNIASAERPGVHHRVLDAENGRCPDESARAAFRPSHGGPLRFGRLAGPCSASGRTDRAHVIGPDTLRGAVHAGHRHPLPDHSGSPMPRARRPAATSRTHSYEAESTAPAPVIFLGGMLRAPISELSSPSVLPSLSRSHIHPRGNLSVPTPTL